jgi:hypothetical protein
MYIMTVIATIVFCQVQAQPKSLEVHFTEISPKIDGVIDEVWDQADSAYDFIQCEPYEMEKSTEKTVVYVLQDHSNLYLAFICHADIYKMTANLTTDEDGIAVGIDPFGCKTTAYYFYLNGSGLYDDGWILDDGRTRDNSWDGVWYFAIKFYDDYYVGEFKIPFKTIRYKSGLDQWGMQFMRYIAANHETDYWTGMLQKEGDMVSKWSTLTGVNPRVQGYNFELYPEVYMRDDRHWSYSDSSKTDSMKIKPSGSLNIKWDITPQMTLSSTLYPDFAQIESDPYTLNLSRYPTILSEKRPFFLEGKDIFRMSDFGENRGFFTPLQLFYSRSVGKSMDGDAVPIIGGLKLTSKAENTNYGLLGAFTGKYERNDTLLETNKIFGVFRMKQRIFQNSDLGMLVSGMHDTADNYNYAVGLDNVYRRGPNQYIVQAAVSDSSGKRGWALSSGMFGFFGPFLALGGASAIHDSFNVKSIGFVPMAGEQKVLMLCGPFNQFQRGFISNIYTALGAVFVKEAGSTDWSKIAVVEFNPNTRNNWGCDLSGYLGPYYEADTNYLYRNANLTAWGNLMGQHLEFGGNYGYSYNYQRGFIACQGSNYVTCRWSVVEHLAVGMDANYWLEWDPENTLRAKTLRLRPNAKFYITTPATITLFSEFIIYDETGDAQDTRLAAVRTGALFSWNFSPKSWIYIALNDYRAEVDEPGAVKPIYQVGAVKAKYLFYF